MFREIKPLSKGVGLVEPSCVGSRAWLYGVFQINLSMASFFWRIETASNGGQDKSVRDQGRRAEWRQS
jgi:hypothetical protein